MCAPLIDKKKFNRPAPLIDRQNKMGNFMKTEISGCYSYGKRYAIRTCCWCFYKVCFVNYLNLVLNLYLFISSKYLSIFFRNLHLAYSLASKLHAGNVYVNTFNITSKFIERYKILVRNIFKLALNRSDPISNFLKALPIQIC